MAVKIVKRPETPKEWEQLLLSFIASLTYADHLGDVRDYIDDVVKILGIEDGLDGRRLDSPDSDLLRLQRVLHAKGITTLNGTR